MVTKKRELVKKLREWIKNTARENPQRYMESMGLKPFRIDTVRFGELADEEFDEKVEEILEKMMIFSIFYHGIIL